MDYLNLGCGPRFHSTWTNVDFTSTGKGVIAHNLIQGIPFNDASFDVVYNSHVLEHFSKNQADTFLQECYRVLRPNGILRIVVPDLEQIAKAYLTTVDRASHHDPKLSANYDWILLEMYDQTVRNSPGGEMAAYFLKEEIINSDFVYSRFGSEAKNLIESGRKQLDNSRTGKLTNNYQRAYRLLSHPKKWRELLLRLMLGQEYKALEIGRFRQGGEIHQWMYDRYSLAVLFKKTGFKNITQRSATDSYIANWTEFNLDTELDGSIYKPDSLFMEAIKLV